MGSLRLATLAKGRGAADPARITQASQDLSKQIFARLEDYLRPVRPGHFFFALSLHQGYHSVMLHAEIGADLKLKLFWKDQESAGRERARSTQAALAAEIEGFWPTYWPEFSTLWPLLPSAQPAPGVDEPR
jgi:hypothetical protein